MWSMIKLIKHNKKSYQVRSAETPIKPLLATMRHARDYGSKHKLAYHTQLMQH